MNFGDIIEDLKTKISPFLEEENLELVEMNLFRSKGRLVLRLLVDKIGGRISLDECAKLNEKISNLLDNLDIIKEERYFLEVSSPGTNRPLKTKNDFLRVKGRKINLFLSETRNGKREFTGILKDIDDFVSLEVNGEILKIAFEKIVKAKQVTEITDNRE